MSVKSLEQSEGAASAETLLWGGGPGVEQRGLRDWSRSMNNSELL